VGTAFTLDPSKSPRTLDFNGAAARVYKGIYEIKGNRLRICYNRETRPTRFDSEEQAVEPYNVLLELERK
jgi:uncharacterized protein (TIGR03067 family)